MAKPYPPELQAMLEVLRAKGFKIEIIDSEHDGAGDPTIRRMFAEQFADPPPARPAEPAQQTGEAPLCLLCGNHRDANIHLAHLRFSRYHEYMAPGSPPAPEPPGKTIEDLERDLATIDERSLTRDSELRNALKGVLAPLDSIALGQSNMDHDIGSLVIRLDDLRKATAGNIVELHRRLDGEVDRLLKRIEALELSKIGQDDRLDALELSHKNMHRVVGVLDHSCVRMRFPEKAKPAKKRARKARK